MSSRVCPRRGGFSRSRADSASSKCRYRAGPRCPERRQRDRAGFGVSTLGVGRGFRLGSGPRVRSSSPATGPRREANAVESTKSVNIVVTIVVEATETPTPLRKIAPPTLESDHPARTAPRPPTPARHPSRPVWREPPEARSSTGRAPNGYRHSAPNRFGTTDHAQSPVAPGS